jgi:hypothetical protein
MGDGSYGEGFVRAPLECEPTRHEEYSSNRVLPTRGSAVADLDPEPGPHESELLHRAVADPVHRSGRASPILGVAGNSVHLGGRQS